MTNTIYSPGTKLRTSRSSVVVTKKGQLYEIRRGEETLFPNHAMWDNEDLWLAEIGGKKEDVTIEPKSTKPIIPHGKMSKWSYDQQLCANNIQLKPPSMTRRLYYSRSRYEKDIQYYEEQIAEIKAGPKSGRFYLEFAQKSLDKTKSKLAELTRFAEKFPELDGAWLDVRKKTKYSFIQTEDNKMLPIYFNAPSGILGTGNPRDPILGRTFAEIGIQSPKTLWVYTDNTFTQLKPISYI